MKSLTEKWGIDVKAYKGFWSDLTCRGYRFSKTEVNRTERANCQQNGFHCAENPLDCLGYYPDYMSSVYYVVEASGDINETEGDSKISCTELRLIRRLSFMELLLEGVAYMIRYPERKWGYGVVAEEGCAYGSYVIVRGKDPVACGSMGGILILVREEPDKCTVAEIAVYRIDGKNYYPNIWYGMNGEKERSAAWRKGN